MLDDDIVKAAEQLLAICKRKNLLVATAESCTAGLVAGTLSEVPGVSSILDRGYITYSNEAKHEVLGHARVHLAVSVTGIAGPDGGSAEKPVGLVHFAAASRTGKLVHVERRYGDIGRSQVRKHSVLQAFRLLHDLAEGEGENPPRAAV